MKVIQPYHEILDEPDGNKILASLEKYGRVCYKSEAKITGLSALEFMRKILKSGHESVVEHEKVSVRIVCDRGVTHEIVRHRIASYSQESTRYCNYHNEKFGRELTMIRPYFWNDQPEKYAVWEATMRCIEDNYNRLIELGASPQEARSILPNSLKTEIIITMNLREWRHFFKLRASPKAHPQMREVTLPLLRDMQTLIPVIFEDIQSD